MPTKRFTSPLTAAVVALTVIGALRAAETNDPQAAAEKQKELIAVLESAAPAADKAITCKYLLVYGDKQAVPALAALLPDPELSSWARIALEGIPGPEADAALREAAENLEGRLLVGVINSIAYRGDPQAVELLASRLKDTDEAVAEVAAVALGKIGNAAAVKALEPAIKSKSAKVRSGAGEGLILAAEKMLATGNASEAARLYELVRQADVPKQRMVEATRGVILARGTQGIPLLVEQLRSEDKTFFNLGLTVARELPGAEVANALVDEAANAAPARQTLLITALADRGDKAALPALLKIAQTGPVPSRIAALGVLEQLGNASCLPVLLEAAADKNEDLAQAALDVLGKLPGDDVDLGIAMRLQQAAGADERKALIQAAGVRRIAATVPALLAAIDDDDSAIRIAALNALGSAVGFDNLGVLIARVTKPRGDEQEQQAAIDALRTACERMPDRETCAKQLVQASSGASTAARLQILEILAAMSGPTALKAVGDAAKSDTPELQDAGSRLLGEWMSVDAGPILMDLAKTAQNSKYKIRAIRGYLRLARQFNMPDPLRAAMCRTALDVIQRKDERLLVLEVLRRYPNLDTLRLAVEMAKDPSLKDEASAAALAIAQKVVGDAITVKDLLEQLGQKPVQIEIVKAEYGAGNKFVDVTNKVRECVRGLPLIVLPSTKYNSAFGGDPVPGVVKQLKIKYTIDGRPGEASFAEDATIVLPVP